MHKIDVDIGQYQALYFYVVSDPPGLTVLESCLYGHKPCQSQQHVISECNNDFEK